ncbi:MAG: GDSL-type esterase/lipase family protein [Phycisphaerae bacterium]
MTQQKKIAWRCFTAILFVCLLPLFTASRATAAKIRVACVGDSITYGYGVPQRRVHGWPGVLQRLLGNGYQVANFGYSGATMLKNGNLPYWKTPDFEAATKFNPNIVIIMLGTNDTKPENWAQFGSQFTANAEAMIRHFSHLKARAKVYICTPPPIIHSNYGISEAMLARGPIPNIHKAGLATSIPVIRIHADLSRFFENHGATGYYQADGVHPNAAGQHRIAQIIFQFLQAPETAAADVEADDGPPSPQGFFLKNGDRVVFYGDSITEQRFYTTDVEMYVRTRFPDLHVRFVNSGVGSDTVRGNWAGGVNLRLKRDVFAFKPDVVAIMLGMNDGGGGGSIDPVLFQNYKNGYEHIIQSLKSHLPGVRIVLIAPSPFDDVTMPPQPPNGYNATLIRFGQFLKNLAAKDHLAYANFNRPLVNVLEKAEKINPQLAQQIIPQRVHPAANGQLVMAEALLKAWNAPATISDVDINAGNKSVSQSTNTTVSALSEAKGSISWTQKDQALPLPIMDLHENWPQFPPILAPVGANVSQFSRSLWMPPTPNWNYTNRVTALVVKLCGFYHNLDSETLRVTGLVAPRYTLQINGQWIGDFSKQNLAVGVNLARYDTPMMAQAYSVLDQVWREAQVRFYIWRLIQLPLEKSQYKFSAHGCWSFVGLPLKNSKPQVKAARSLIGLLYHNLFKTVAARCAVMAEPVPCEYTLSPTAVAKPAPAGVLYQDTFKGGPLIALNGCRPTVRPGHNIRWAAAGWNADGSTTAAGNAYLPFTPVGGNIYTLSAGLNPKKGAGSGWLAIGFVEHWNPGAGHPNTGVTAFFANGAIGAGPWAAVYPDRGAGGSGPGGGGGGATVVGPGANGITRWTTTDGVQHITIVLNTMDQVWTYRVLDNGVEVTPTTPFPTNPTITGVALGNAEVTKGAVSDFELSAVKTRPLASVLHRHTSSPTAVAKPVPAGVLYQDTFKGGPLVALNGREPTAKKGHHIGWAAGAGWKADGSTTAAGNAYLPFTPVGGNIYTLSAGLNPKKGAGSGWLAIGFVEHWNPGTGHPNTGVTAFFANGAIGAGPWAAVYPDRGAGGSGPGGGGGGATVVGPGANGITRWTTTDGVQKIAIVLNTVGQVWTYEVLDNGVVVTPTTPFSANPTITGIALGNAEVTKGAVSNFQLAVGKTGH